MRAGKSIAYIDGKMITIVLPKDKHRFFHDLPVPVILGRSTDANTASEQQERLKMVRANDFCLRFVIWEPPTPARGAPPGQAKR